MPSFDDELKSHLSGQAEVIGVEPALLSDVERIGRRRGRRRRALGVAGAMALVVGAAVGVRPLFRDDGSTLDVAANVAPATDSTSTTAAPAPVDGGAQIERSSNASAVAPIEGDLAYGYGYGGETWTVPWGDGFLTLGTVWEPAPLPGPDSPYAESFPQEIVDAVRASGATTLDGAMAALDDVGLLQQATDLVMSDPDLVGLFESLQSGATPSFVAQTSPDGLHWSDIPGFALPVAGAQIDRVVSDGTHLVVAQRADDRGIAFDSGSDQGQVSLTVSVTQNLTDWQTFDISEPMADAPAYVSTDQWMRSLTYNADGWLALVESSRSVDLWSLVPSEIIDAGDITGPRATADGLEIHFFSPGGDMGGVPMPALEGSGAVSTSTFLPSVTAVLPIPPYPAITPDLADPAFMDPPGTDTIFYTWEELGVDPVEIQQYLDESGGFGRSETSITVGSWDSQPMSMSLAGTSGEGLEEVVGTDAGFIGQGFGRLQGEPQLMLSPDGLTWNSVDPPASRFLGAIVAVEGGVLLSADGPSGPELWFGAPDGSSWTRSESLDLGIDPRQGIYFNPGDRGAIAVVDVHQYQDNSQPPVEFDVEVEFDGKLLHLFGHADGTADLTITDAETGEIVAEVSGEFDGFSADFAVLNGDSVTIIEPDGTEIMDVPLSIIMDTVLPAREAAIDASGWTPPPLVPEMPELVLIASSDGVNWLTAPLDGSEYPSTMAINGSLVAINTSSGWQTFTIG